MSKYTCFDVSVKDHVAHVVMNRPDEFNSMTRLFWKELPEIVKELDKNAEARVILLKGEGKHFNAGMDLANFAPAERMVQKKILLECVKLFIMKCWSYKIPLQL